MVVNWYYCPSTSSCLVLNQICRGRHAQVVFHLRCTSLCQNILKPQLAPKLLAPAFFCTHKASDEILRSDLDNSTRRCRDQSTSWLPSSGLPTAALRTQHLLSIKDGQIDTFKMIQKHARIDESFLFPSTTHGICGVRPKDCTVGSQKLLFRWLTLENTVHQLRDISYIQWHFRGPAHSWPVD